MKNASGPPDQNTGSSDNFLLVESGEADINGGVAADLHAFVEGGERIVVLPNGHELPGKLATMFRQHVSRRIPDLPRERKYKLRQICGEDFWSLLTHTEARKGGMYIAYLVATGQLPLEFVTCPHAVPKRYCLK